MTDERPLDADRVADGSRDEGEPEPVEREQVEQQDLTARNVIMSNALQGGVSPAAGGVVGSGGHLGMEPTLDEEERAADESALPEHERDRGPRKQDEPRRMPTAD